MYKTEKEKILITGSNGQLGQAFKSIQNDYPEIEFIFTTKENFDITDKNQCEKFIADNKPTTIVNCAAYTNVDKAENDFNVNAINAEGPLNLSELSIDFGFKLIHISTDYVFGGEKNTPYTEFDTTNPLNVYGKSKLKGERNLQQVNAKRTIILRVSWLWSEFGNNFYKTMIRLGENNDELRIIFDQIGTPTNAIDLAEAIIKITPKVDEIGNTEIYNFSNEGVASWYDFAYMIMKRKKIDCLLHPIKTDEYHTPAKRPLFTVMNKEKIKNSFGIIIPHWCEKIV